MVVLLPASCGGGGGPGLPGDGLPSIGETTTTVDDGTTAAPPTDSGGESPDLNEDAVVSVDEGAAAGEVRALVRSIAVGETVRYAGFTIEIERVDVGFDPAGIRVATVHVTLMNDTPKSDRIQTAVEIASGGDVGRLDRDMTPEVPAGGTGDGVFSVRLEPSFSFADAVLSIGRPDRQRVTVPLGETGERQTRLPEVIEPAGAGAADGTSIDVARLTLGWDTVNPRGQAAPGRVYVTVDYVLESAVATAVNDGTIVLLDGTGREWAPLSATVQAVDAGVPSDLQAVFEIDEPVPDGLVLRYVERFGNGEVEAALTTP